MDSVADEGDRWPEVAKAASEKRRELVLQGPAVDARVSSAGGLSSEVYSLTLLNYLEVSQCPGLTRVHEDIRNLTSLQSLVLCRNKLLSVPSVDALQALKVLDLSVNQLEALPAGLSSLKELTTLNLSCNRLESLPEGLSQCPRLSTLNVSKNRLLGLPPDLCSERLELLSTLLASDNGIRELSAEVHRLPALKILDLSNNQLSEIPPTLSDCPKLKEINFKGNKLRDRRLEKMVNGCQTKSVLEYLRGRGRSGPEGGSDAPKNTDKSKKKGQKKSRAPEPEEPDEAEDAARMLVRVLHVSSAEPALTVTVSPEVKEVRPYLVCCLVRGLRLRPGNSLKRFLMAQTKLHEDICGKRTTATIATHDVRLLKGPLTYGVKPPTQLKITALGRKKEMTAVELVRHLHLEAEELRKQKKRQNVTGLHKYLQLLDGKPLFPCLTDAEGRVVSFPPITNSEHTKISKTTTELFVEVTSASSLQTCKDVMDALILKMCELNKFTAEHAEEAGSDGEGSSSDSDGAGELTVQQLRTVDPDGGLKVVYPSKTDLSDCPGVTVLW